MTIRVLIIGAGIIGTALADQLVHRAHVTVVDAHTPGRGTSATSLAWLNANKTVDPHYFDFRMAALRRWTDLAAEFGHPHWYAPSGNLTWAQTEMTRTELSARVERLRTRDYPAHLVTAAEARDIEPALNISSKALIAHFPGEGFVHGTQAAQALISRAQRTGVHLISGDPAVALNVHGDHVTGVRLGSGRAMTADVTICAAGWRTPEILATADLSIPLLDVHASGSAAPCLVATTTPASGALRGLVHAPHIYARPAWDGGLVLEASDLDADTDMATLPTTLRTRADELLTRARNIIPVLTRVQVSEARRCVRPMPVDGFPLIGWRRPGLFVAVTHSGITLAPHLAQLIAHELTTGNSTDALSRFSLDRTMS